MKGMGTLNLLRGGYDIYLGSEGNSSANTTNKCVTISFNIHHVEAGKALPITTIPFDQADCLKALGQALIDLGLMKDNATDAELKATKFHLEDFRKLVFNNVKSEG